MHFKVMTLQCTVLGNVAVAAILSWSSGLYRQLLELGFKVRQISPETLAFFGTVAVGKPPTFNELHILLILLCHNIHSTLLCRLFLGLSWCECKLLSCHALPLLLWPGRKEGIEWHSSSSTCWLATFRQERKNSLTYLWKMNPMLQPGVWSGS